MNFDKSCVDLLLEVLKGWENPFDHRESLIHISSCVEASHTVQKELLYAETVGLEEMKRFGMNVSNPLRSHFILP